jgi:hypothetical protein
MTTFVVFLMRHEDGVCARSFSQGEIAAGKAVCDEVLRRAGWRSPHVLITREDGDHLQATCDGYQRLMHYTKA